MRVMGQATISNYSWIDFVFSVIGVFTFFVDWGADVWVATEFYSRGDFFWFGLLVSLMVLSSVLVQMFSWFWLKYDRELPDHCRQSGGGTVLFGDQVQISGLLHVLQLGFLCRSVPIETNQTLFSRDCKQAGVQHFFKTPVASLLKNSCSRLLKKTGFPISSSSR